MTRCTVLLPTMVSMSMVDVGIVCMAVGQGLVHMRVAVWFPAVPWTVMSVLVMRIVAMAMAVCQGFVLMFVGVPLTDMQPDAAGHQATGKPEREARMLAEQEQ